ncbi:hypothetical protein BC829DRAFT_404133 [Chytridium lagenaria]|nr:hypothetical protein BC829DRAFT_404133 [Chytridium lagenaria]
MMQRRVRYCLSWLIANAHGTKPFTSITFLLKRPYLSRTLTPTLQTEHHTHRSIVSPAPDSSVVESLRLLSSTSIVVRPNCSVFTHSISSQCNLGSCPCDLTAFSCDINCGCLAEPDMLNNLAALGASTLRNSDGVVCVVYNNSNFCKYCFRAIVSYRQFQEYVQLLYTKIYDRPGYDIVSTGLTNKSTSYEVRCTDILPVWDPATRACFNMFSTTSRNRGAVILGARASVQLGNAIASAGRLSSRNRNPGYMSGNPSFPELICSTSPAVALYADPIDGITLPMDAPTGPDSAPYFACSTSPTNRVPINFGEDISGGCTLVISFADISNATGCNAIRRTALNAQTSFGKLLAINRIGQFGNANSTNPNDWVTILTKDVGEKDFLPSEPGTCTGVLTSLDIQILTADFGSTKNPQPGIIGLRILYNWNKIVFRCLRPLDCQLSDRTTTQRFRLRSTVTYFRVPNQGAKPFIPPSPRLIPLLPDDLFYPFRLPPSGSFAGRNMAGRVGIGLALVIILLLRL